MKNKYWIKNVHIIRLFQLQVGADSILGENVTIGEKVSIKKSVLGKNCTVGDGVKITNSVVMDGVSISQKWVSYFQERWLTCIQFCSIDINCWRPFHYKFKWSVLVISENNLPLIRGK